MTEQPIQQPGKRIEFIDAMRGFTMILVVFQHVATYCWHMGKGMSFHDFFLQVRMPMFFFISGFVLYKAGVVWDFKQIKAFFKKKIPVQLISPFIFFCVYLYFIDASFYKTNFDPSREGYWFTFVLFAFYVIYATVRFFIRNNWSDIVLLLIGGALMTVITPTGYLLFPLPHRAMEFLCVYNWQYFIFFVLGTLAKKYYPQLERILDNHILLTVCIIIFFLTNAYIDVIPINDKIIRHLLSFPGLVILFSFFRINKRSFSKEKRLGRTLQYVGRRTLDVYLIHFFLLPKQLSFVTVFTDHPMPIIEAAVTLSIAIIIVAVSLLIGNIFRLSPFLAHWVFGVKYSKPDKQLNQ